MATGVVSYDAWTLARQRFCEDLDEHERSLFVNATLHNVFYTASAAQKSYEADSKSKTFAAKTETFLAGISAWGQALDVYANTSALFLCPLWGSIRVLIHVGTSIPPAYCN